MNQIITREERVRRNTSSLRNLIIDDEILENIAHYSSRTGPELTLRITELDREWDVEHVLETSMSTLAIAGLILSVVADRKWLAVPTVVLGFFAQHATQGWCPPLTLLRFLKVRTCDEINQEKHALKALRGDYEGIRTAEEAYFAAK
ncbi:MAG: hypothetical protein WEC12_00585 [Balneolaceae bacterium]